MLFLVKIACKSKQNSYTHNKPAYYQIPLLLSSQKLIENNNIFKNYEKCIRDVLYKDNQVAVPQVDFQMGSAKLWPWSSFKYMTFNTIGTDRAAFKHPQVVLYRDIAHLAISKIISSLDNKSE